MCLPAKKVGETGEVWGMALIITITLFVTYVRYVWVCPALYAFGLSVCFGLIWYGMTDMAWNVRFEGSLAPWE